MMDAVICSADVKSLKSEPEAFFGPYLNSINKEFKDAILVDCESRYVRDFVQKGGKHILYKYQKDDLSYSLRRLKELLIY